MKPEFSRQIFKNTQILNFMKILPVGAEFIPCGRTNVEADGRTDMTKLTVAFRYYAKAQEI